MNKISLRVNAPTLTCVRENGELAWTLLIEQIVLIAEYATNEGPYVDDYFLVFVTIEDSQSFFSTCTFYAEGRDSALSALSERLGSKLEPRLYNSANWKSRIIWPSSLQWHDYFTFEVAPSKSFLQRLKQRVSGPDLEYRISEEVVNYIKACQQFASP